MPEGTVSSDMGIPPCHSATARGCADGVLGMTLAEASTLVSKSVNVRSPHYGVTKAPKAHGPEFVWVKQHKVHLFTPHALRSVGRETAS